MKTLYLVRHAKSDWSNPKLEDFDRPLNEKGQWDAPKMGERLKVKKITPDLMVSSPAERAIKTARKMASAMDYDKKKISVVATLYHASCQEILRVVQSTSSSVEKLMVFGHNPGLTDFANVLCADGIDNIATAGVFALQLDIEDWKQVTTNRKARLLFYDYPKKYTD